MPLPTRLRRWWRRLWAARRRLQVHEAVGLQDNVTVTAYDVTGLRARHSDWAALPKPRRRRLVEATAPVRWRQTTHNVTCTAWHEQCAARFNFKNDMTEVRDDPATVALGTDDSSFSVSDTSLNNKVGEIDLTDPANQGDEWSSSEFLSSVELNGYTIREMGVVSESGALYNHAAIGPFDKDSNTAAIIETTVPFGDQSEV